MLFFYTGADPTKPSYRRGVLDTLSYPGGHVLEYSYRKENIASGLTDLKGKVAAIVFADVNDAGAPTYMPLRFAEVLDHSPIAGAGARERIGFLLRLRDFVGYPADDKPDHWHASIAALDQHRHLATAPRLFVIEAQIKAKHWQPPEASPSGKIPEEDPGKSLKVWEDLVTNVARSSKLKDAIFVKIDLRNLDALTVPPLKPVRRRSLYQVLSLKPAEKRVLYQVRSGNVYQLDICVYQSPPTGGKTAGDAKISLAHSSEVLEVGQPLQSALSGLAQHSALVSCKRTIERNLVALSVTVDEPVTGVVNTPHPFFLLRIALPWIVTVGFVVCVFLGSLLVASDLDTVKGLLAHAPSWLSSQAASVNVLAKWLGAIFLAAAAFLGFRKLPSGQ
ncbi:MAG TPA: hypothetical protein VL523_09905 [Terriglobia bacterium]|nr:hypothetical protein [Terriglobia bacterium]